MKLKLIFGVSLAAAATAVYLNWPASSQPAIETTQVVADHSTPAAQTQPSAPAGNTAVATAAPRKPEQIIRDAADAHQVIDQQLEAILTSDTAPDLAIELAPVAKAFPQLKPQIDEYVSSVAEQQKAVADFRQKLAERNTQVAADGSSSSSIDSMLDYDKTELLAQARRLGEQGMALNQAIREAAYGQPTP